MTIMASLIQDYKYDIFISYRQKDNKYDGWVTEFVENLKRELEATFKEEVSVYFDINPHDGLLETHDVDASLKEKLKCLVFIPIISRTYCDPKSFAWEHEFKAFVESASKDQFGLKVKLPNGNVANRVLPVRIHDLDKDDINLCESVLGGVLRGVEFIYKEPGVNKPLTSEDDDKKNLNKTKYRIQINKIANAIKEIVSGLMGGEVVSGEEKPEHQLPWEEAKKEKRSIPLDKPTGINKNRLLSYLISGVFVLLLLGVYAFPKIFKRDIIEKLRASGEKISVTIFPFQNMTNDTIWNVWQEGIQKDLINSLSNNQEQLKVRQKETINGILQTRGLSQYSAISPNIAKTISQQLKSDIFIYGSIRAAGNTIRVDAQLIDTKTKEVLKSFEINGPSQENIIFDITDSLRKKITDFLLISKLLKEYPDYQNFQVHTSSPDAFRYAIYGERAFYKGDFSSAENWFLKSLAIDSNYFDAYANLPTACAQQGKNEQSLQWIIKMYKKRNVWPINEQLFTNWAYAWNFESPEVQIRCLKQWQEADDQALNIPYLLGITYNKIGQYDKAIIEFKITLEYVRNSNEKNSWIYPALGETYHGVGLYKEEKKLYEEGERNFTDKGSTAYSWLVRDQASLALTLKDSIAANRYIDKYISVLKGYSASEAEVAEGLGRIYGDAGIYDKAEGYYRKGILLDPGNPERLNRYAGFLCRNNQNPDEFVDIIDKAIASAHNKYDYYNYLDTKGWGLYKYGMLKEAIAVLEKAWSESPYPMSFIKFHLEEVKMAVAGQKSN